MEPKVFISYATEDEAMADEICGFLEPDIPCWIAHRDILPGADWPPAITKSIRQANVMVLIFTSRSNDSNNILREVQMALDKGLKVIALRVENIEPSDGLTYFLSAIQWLQAYPAPLKKYLPKLTETIKKLIGPSDQGEKNGPTKAADNFMESTKDNSQSHVKDINITTVERKYSPRVIVSAIGVLLAMLSTISYISNDIRFNDVKIGFLNISFLAGNVVLLVALFMSSNSQTRDYKLIKICTYFLIAFTLFALGVSLATGALSGDYVNFGCLLVYGLILYLHRKDY